MVSSGRTSISTRPISLVTGQSPGAQNHSLLRIKTDGGALALLGQRDSGVAADRHRDRFPRIGAAQEQVRHVSFEGDVENVAFDCLCRGSIQSKRLRPDKQNGLVANPESTGV